MKNNMITTLLLEVNIKFNRNIRSSDNFDGEVIIELECGEPDEKFCIGFGKMQTKELSHMQHGNEICFCISSLMRDRYATAFEKFRMRTMQSIRAINSLTIPISTKVDTVVEASDLTPIKITNIRILYSDLLLKLKKHELLPETFVKTKIICRPAQPIEIGLVAVPAYVKYLIGNTDPSTGLANEIGVNYPIPTDETIPERTKEVYQCMCEHVGTDLSTEHKDQYCTCSICGDTFPIRMQSPEELKSLCTQLNQIVSQAKLIARTKSVRKEIREKLCELYALVEEFPEAYEVLTAPYICP